MKEETSLDIYDIEFLLFQEFIYDERFWKRSHFLFFDYACKTDSTGSGATGHLTIELPGGLAV